LFFQQVQIICIVNGTDLGLPSTDETMSCLDPANTDYFATIDQAHCSTKTPIKLKIKVKNTNDVEITIKRSTRITFNGESISLIDTFFNTTLLPKHTREVIYEGFFDSCNAAASTTSIILRVKSGKGKNKNHGGCKCTHLFMFIFFITI